MSATKPSAASKQRSRPSTPPVKPPAAPPKHPLWPYAVGVLGALFVLFEVYGPALRGAWLFDDTLLPYTLPQFADAPLRSWIAGQRPVLMASFWLNFQQVGSENTYPYHVVNVLLHWLNGILVYLAVRKILQRAPKIATNFGSQTANEILSLFGAALFLLHPLQTESVSYVASRSETLSVFFVLSSFVLFLYRRRTDITFPVALGVLALLGLGLLTKEHAAALFGVFLLTDYFWNPGFSLGGIRRNWKLYAPAVLLAAAGGVFVWRVLSRANTAGFGMKDLTWYQYFLSQCRALWRYLILFVFPAGQNLDYDFPISHNLLEHLAIVGLLLLLAACGVLWMYRARFPVIAYGFFVALILFAPTSSFVPIRDILVERRMYLPFIGLVFVAVGALQRWKVKPTTLAVALSAVLLIEGALTYRRNLLWSNPIDMWTDTVSKSPRKPRPNFQLAYAHYQAGGCPEAVRQFERTSQLQPPAYDLFVDWALALDCAGNFNAAVEKLNQAAAIEPSAHVFSQIGMEYAKSGRYPEALDVLETAARLDPNFEMTYAYRGGVFEKLEKPDRAAEEYHHALAIDPKNLMAIDGLRRLGR
jgi:tetratricopeptide (TPR) repeat protein